MNFRNPNHRMILGPLLSQSDNVITHQDLSPPPSSIIVGDHSNCHLHSPIIIFTYHSIQVRVGNHRQKTSLLSHPPLHGLIFTLLFALMYDFSTHMCQSFRKKLENCLRVFLMYTFNDTDYKYKKFPS